MEVLIQTRCGYLPFAGFDQAANVGTDRFAIQQVYFVVLTDKLRCSKNVLELISCLNLMRDPKINQFNPGVGHVLVKQHDILRLEGKKIGRERESETDLSLTHKIVRLEVNNACTYVLTNIVVAVKIVTLAW